MKIKLLFAFLLVSFFAVAQPTNYQNIAARYRWMAGYFIDGFHVPGYSTVPNLRTGVWPGAGNIGLDTVAHKFYFYSGGTWREVAPAIDSLIWATRARLQQKVDSLGAVKWGLTGNAGTTPGTQFIGTTDNQDFVVKTNGVEKISISKGNLITTNDSVKIIDRMTGLTQLIIVGDGSEAHFDTYNDAGNMAGHFRINLDSYLEYSAVDNGGIFPNVSGAEHIFYVNNNEVVRFDYKGAIGIATPTPAASSLLDITSTSKGILIPRMTTTQRNAISLPAIGLMIYNTTDSAFNFYRASGWSAIGGGSGSYTFSNGLTEAAGAVKWGGTLTGNTTVDLNGKDLTFDDNLGSNIYFNSGGNQRIGITSSTKMWSNNGSSYLEIKNDSITIKPNANLYITALPYTLSTTGKKILLRDTATGLVQNIDPALLGGSTSLSSLTAATGTNTIDNGLLQQYWQWNTLAGGIGLRLESQSAAATTNSQQVLRVEQNGSNYSASQTTYSAYVINQKGGTNGTNVAGYFDANTGTTNIAGKFVSTSGTNNYAIIVPASSGSVGIGTSTPAKILHTVGTVRHETLGTASGDTTTYKPVGINSSGDIVPMTHWSVAPVPTNTLATFGAGAGLATDTAAFQLTSIYGSFFWDGTDTLIVTKSCVTLQGTSANIDYDIYFNDSLNVTAGASTILSSINITSTTTAYCTDEGFITTKIPPGNWVWVKTSTLTTKPTYFSLSLIGYKKPVI